MSVFTSWPPDLTTELLELLTLLATTYALSHSLLYLRLHPILQFMPQSL